MYFNFLLNYNESSGIKGHKSGGNAHDIFRQYRRHLDEDVVSGVGGLREQKTVQYQHGPQKSVGLYTRG